MVGGLVEFIAKLVPELDESKVQDACKGFDGQNTQMIAILKIASPAHKQWVEGTREEMSLQQQWLDFKNKEFVANPTEALSQLDDFLQNNSFLSSKSRVMLADFALFFVVKDLVKPDTAHLSLRRWANTIQSSAAVRRALSDHKWVTFHLNDAFLNKSNVDVVKKGEAPKDNVESKAPKQPKATGESKAPKQPKAKAAAQAPEVDDQPEVTKLDIRVGLINKCWDHEASDKLYCEEIDVGEAEPRQIGSGLRAFYSESSMIQGRKVLVLCNLKPRKLAGFASNGMVLCASNADHTQVELVDVPEGAVVGERVTFGGIEGTFEPWVPNLINKKKVFEAVAPCLKTSDDKIPCWINPVSGISHPFTTSAGVCTVSTIQGGGVS